MRCESEGCERKPHARGKCRNCYDRWLKGVNPEYRKRQLASSRKWRSEHGEYRRSYEYDRSRDLAAERYGISRADVDALLARGCELCGRTDALCIDHDHATGAVRGCLCVTCNVGVGWLEKVEWSDRARAYLQRAATRS